MPGGVEQILAVEEGNGSLGGRFEGHYQPPKKK